MKKFLNATFVVSLGILLGCTVLLYQVYNKSQPQKETELVTLSGPIDSFTASGDILYYVTIRGENGIVITGWMPKKYKIKGDIQRLDESLNMLYNNTESKIITMRGYFLTEVNRKKSKYPGAVSPSQITGKHYLLRELKVGDLVFDFSGWIK